MSKHEEVKNGVIFPVGEKNEAFAQGYTQVQTTLTYYYISPKLN